MDARGLTESGLIDGATPSTMDELGILTVEVDKILVFNDRGTNRLVQYLT